MNYFVNKKKSVIAHDYLMAMLAWLLSWWLRFNLDFPYFNWEMSVYVLPLVLLVQGLVFNRFKLHRGIWRFASLPDLWNIFRASIIGNFSIALVLFISIRLEGIPRTVLILYPILLMFFLGGPRLIYRMWKDHSLNLNSIKQGKKVLIVGAGAAGDMLVRDMLRDGGLHPIGFIDDNDKLINSEIHGVQVIGTVNEIPQICQERSIELIIIAIPTATNHQMQRILDICKTTECDLRTLPSFQDMVSGRVSLNQLREV